jgi:hypothetical protein
MARHSCASNSMKTSIGGPSASSAQSAAEIFLRFRFPCSGVARVLVEVFNAVFVNEEIRLRFPCDANDVLIVVFDPAPNLFAVDKLYDDGSPVFRETVNVLGLAESRFWRGLPPISTARVLMGSSKCHVPQYSGFDVNIQE